MSTSKAKQSPVEEFRNNLIEQLKKELIGPDTLPGDKEEILEESPRQRYSAGVLFPSKVINTELDDNDEQGEESKGETVFGEGSHVISKKRPKKGYLNTDESSSGHDDTITMANTYMPSAMGISFLCSYNKDGLVISPEAATYTTAKKKVEDKEYTVWVRNPLGLPDITISLEAQEEKISVITKDVSENLKIKAVIRYRTADTRLVTISIYNSKKSSGDSPVSGADCFFQTGFKVSAKDKSPIFIAYQELLTHSKDPEEISLRLLYRKRLSYGVGHGCAVNWGTEKDSRVNSVETDSFPFQKIPPVVPRQGKNDELSMIKLAGGLDGSNQQVVPSLLQNLVSDYSSWINDITEESDNLTDDLKEVAKLHILKCEEASNRIQQGIDILNSNPIALKIFCLANKAMLMQQYHSSRDTRRVNDPWEPLTEDYKPEKEWMGYWRTFQLAFIVMNIASVTPDSNGNYSESRNLVDLIWFPTGGGKTEAYLGLAAYTIFLRRILKPSNAGCTVLMRYTLRLLTSQQFQRASALICACETIRQDMTEILGLESISIGLWVGLSLTPNKRADAISTLNNLVRKPQYAENKFQLLKCPWCGTKLDEKGKLGYKSSGRSPKTVFFVCPEKRCSFSTRKNPLPVLVTDEDIYDKPPSLLIGTVDKFAMLAWREEASSLFGGSKNSPPELIIQDELHLISGPLGTMVGLYEGVIDLLCDDNDVKPKIVGSTATIRRADDQCKKLYNRPTFQFPPSGIDASDSYFAKEDNTESGRIYLGVFPSASPSFVTALVRTAGGLLQGVRTLDLPDGADESVRDPYWTLVEYFNSLRELGRALTLLQADIPEYMWAIVSRSNIPKEKVRNLFNLEELTSRKTAEEIPKILEELEYTYSPNDKSKHNPIDALLATNMISVGVDVDRLGLMTIIGQPKTTSEYIQASSRVGRSKDAPGLVVTMYNPGKPRDRSHFEQFRTYHSALYRYVEPTSVTPYSIPVLERALHALLVIIGRHIGKWKQPDDVDFGSDSVLAAINYVRERCKAVDPDHYEVLNERLEYLIQHWENVDADVWGSFGNLDDTTQPLMYPAGTPELSEWDNESWETPSSMRSVDSEAEAEIIYEYPE